MPSSQTPNYGLSRWALDDKVLMSDFNDDNTKIDAALKAEADTRANAIQAEASARSAGLQEAANARAAMAATLATRGNCRIVCGSYTGNNLAGEANPCTLTFDKPPVAVFVLPANNPFQGMLALFRGATLVCSSPEYLTSQNFISWSGNSVSWYNRAEPLSQLNQQIPYVYIAFLAEDGAV